MGQPVSCWPKAHLCLLEAERSKPVKIRVIPWLRIVRFKGNGCLTSQGKRKHDYFLSLSCPKSKRRLMKSWEDGFKNAGMSVVVHIIFRKNDKRNISKEMADCMWEISGLTLRDDTVYFIDSYKTWQDWCSPMLPPSRSLENTIEERWWW